MAKRKDTVNKGGRPKGLPKTGGRKKGTPNKLTSETKQMLAEIVRYGVENIKDGLDSMEFDKLEDEIGTYFSIVSRFLPYVLPKQTETKVSIDEEQVQSIQESMNKLDELFKQP
jgi:hypothetical protein